MRPLLQELTTLPITPLEKPDGKGGVDPTAVRDITPLDPWLALPATCLIHQHKKKIAELLWPASIAIGTEHNCYVASTAAQLTYETARKYQQDMVVGKSYARKCYGTMRKRGSLCRMLR